MVYLSNMYGHGATNCANEIYHSWFGDGTIYDDALTSPNGPAPGYVPGGANPSFRPGLRLHRPALWRRPWTSRFRSPTRIGTPPGRKIPGKSPSRASITRPLTCTCCPASFEPLTYSGLDGRPRVDRHGDEHLRRPGQRRGSKPDGICVQPVAGSRPTNRRCHSSICSRKP